MYSDVIGTLREPSDDYVELINNRIKSKNKVHDSEYEFVRYGIPSGAISFEETKKEREILLLHYRTHGYTGWPASKLSSKFKKHVAKLRASLDLYEEFVDHMSISKDEYYYRCLNEGASFTEWLKKARSTSLRALSSETDTDIDEDYYVETYKGYNSLLHERYLINWDATDGVEDIKYAFIPITRRRDDYFRELANQFWTDFKLDQIDLDPNYDMIGGLRNTKMLDPTTGKSNLMREYMSSDINLDSPYFAKRSVVAVSPGNVRDTGVGDPSTIAKVKVINSLCRQLTDHIPYSANTDETQANLRLKRVLKRNAFLHLDFKKFGLTFPRNLSNIVLEIMKERNNVDTSILDITNFYIQIEGETYRTERGSVLGWLDCLHSISVSIILHSLLKELKFDFVTFNDDVEISKFCKGNLKETMELLRMTVITVLDSFDIPISINKTYASKGSIFLERYAYFGEYNLDMYKEQLTIEAYSKSLITEFPWQAKLLFAAAEQWTKNNYATERCIDTCPVEFRKEEISLPLWSGGWYIRREKGLDLSLVESDRLGIRCGIEFSKFKAPRYTTRPAKVGNSQQIVKSLEIKTRHAYSPEMFIHLKGEVETVSQINEEIEYIVASLQTKCDTYPGRNEFFPRIIMDIVSESRVHIEPEPD